MHALDKENEKIKRKTLSTNCPVPSRSVWRSPKVEESIRKEEKKFLDHEQVTRCKRCFTPTKSPAFASSPWCACKPTLGTRWRSRRTAGCRRRPKTGTGPVERRSKQSWRRHRRSWVTRWEHCTINRSKGSLDELSEKLRDESIDRESQEKPNGDLKKNGRLSWTMEIKTAKKKTNELGGHLGVNQ